jgi:LuxR family maltose regulon positive regulatory protein
VHYQWNELAEAAQHFQAIAQYRYGVQSLTARNGLFGLLRVQLVRGETAAAEQTLDLASRYDLDVLGYETADMQSARALVQYAQGAKASAWRWADAFGAPVPDQPLYWPQNAHLAKAWLLLARGGAADVQAALRIIDALHEIAERMYNTRFRIALLALRALALEAQGQERSAQAALGQAVELAQPGGFLRVFVDLGPRMEVLLARLARHNAAPEAIHRILAAFPAPDRRMPPRPPQPDFLLAAPLTSREIDILLLLRDRLSDKEIAGKLVVAPATVKRHLANLYDKLDVNKRRDAVARAEELGILQPR